MTSELLSPGPVIDSITIYRVDKKEDPTKGPLLFANDDLSMLANMLDCQDPHLMPRVTKCKEFHFSLLTPDKCFGFHQRSCVFRWFDEIMREYLHNVGFCLSTYVIDRHLVTTLDDQCLFDPTLGQRTCESLLIEE